MSYNCCRQASLCPMNKICKPLNSMAKPWKRFTCECPDGYHGDNCDQPIRSCAGYVGDSRISGIRKVVGYNNSVYDVFCHFHSGASWTLVQSYGFVNVSIESNFRKSLYESHPLNENSLTWSAYRLSKLRMKSIKDNSTFLQFTCDYEKIRDIEQSDYVQIPLQDIEMSSENVSDVLELDESTTYLTIREDRGKIGNDDLSKCQMWLHQSSRWSLLMGFTNESQTDDCIINHISNFSCHDNEYYFFSSDHLDSICIKKLHRCVQHDNSTTQLWFGTP